MFGITFSSVKRSKRTQDSSGDVIPLDAPSWIDTITPEELADLEAQMEHRFHPGDHTPVHPAQEFIEADYERWHDAVTTGVIEPARLDGVTMEYRPDRYGNCVNEDGTAFVRSRPFVHTGDDGSRWSVEFEYVVDSDGIETCVGVSMRTYTIDEHVDPDDLEAGIVPQRIRSLYPTWQRATVSMRMRRANLAAAAVFGRAYAASEVVFHLAHERAHRVADAIFRSGVPEDDARRIYTDEQNAEVARVWHESVAAKRRPSREIANHFGWKLTQAENAIKRVRKLGLIPPSTRGKKKEDS